MTLDKVRAVLHYDSVTGKFRWLVARGRKKAGSVAGTKNRKTGYVYVSVFGKIYLAHRLAWFWMLGQWPENQIDHVNRVRSDNRWDNLREASCAENSRNAPARGKVKGVTWHKGARRWMAQIRVNNRCMYLGMFSTAAAAHAAYVAAAKEYHGVFASF